MVESRCGAVALGSVWLLPPLSSGGVIGDGRTQTSVCVQCPVEGPESNRSAFGVLSPFFQAFGVEPRDRLRPIAHP